MTTETIRSAVPTALAAAALAAGLALAAPAGAIITGGGCLADVHGSQNCTANDVTFVVVGLGIQDDGCVNTADTVSIFLQGTVRNTTAQSRYDIGLWVATDGDPNGDGAISGVCARDRLFPLAGIGATCGSASTQMDLLRQFDNYAPFTGIDNGPYLNLDGDSCGDLNAVGNSGCDVDGNGQWDDSIVRFTEALTFPCDDDDGNGFVEIPTCASWGNNSNQVGGATCDSETEVGPGTPAKCRCEVLNSTIPTPALGLNCSSPSQTLGQGQTGTFSVTYNNSSTCSPLGSMPEREQCGTASFVFYVIDYDETKGTVSNISAGSGSFTHNATNGTITWTPASSRNATAGIVGPGDSASLSYDFTYTANQVNDTVSASTTTYWTNSAATLGNPSGTGVVAQATLACNAAVTATPVTLSSFRVVGAGGRSTLRWTTATETANLGFNVYTETAGGWERINDRPIPSKVFDSTVPTAYQLDVSDVRGGRFMIEDLALDGTATLHGPFRRSKAYGGQPRIEAVDWTAIRTEAAARSERSVGRKGKPAAAATAARLMVDRDGVQRVSFEDLLAAGFDFSGTPSSQLALLAAGGSVPIRVEPSGGTFGPGSFIEFVGEAKDTLYTRTNVYTLLRDPRRALRVAEDKTRPRGGAATTAYSETLKVERDRVYNVASPGDDPWYDQRLIAFGAPVGVDLEVDLEGYRAGAGSTTLEVELLGVTTWPEPDDHHAVVSWNGTPVADVLWDGQAARRIEVPIPAGAVAAGKNRLRIELSGDRGVLWDVVDLESYSVTYPRQLAARDGALAFRAAGGTLTVAGVAAPDASVYRLGATGPVRVSGAAYDAATGSVTLPGASSGAAEYVLAAPAAAARPRIEATRDAAYVTSGAAEYLVVSHGAFLDGLAPLVAARQAQGLTVKVVDVADVYEAFSHGVFDPAAIRDYVAHAAREMGTHYVLLVGADTFDYHDRLGQGSVSFVPSLYAATGPIVRFAPVDPLFADVDGDRIPDLPIGRLPVRTAAELDTVIDKILLYEGKGYGKTALFVADERDTTSGFSFSQASEGLAQALPAGWSVERAYVETLGAGGARQKLVQALGDGVALTTFAGHSGLTHWTFGNVFGATDVAALANDGEPTVVVQWGCWNTYHVEPRFHTLGHRFLLTEGKGAAAVLGSATLLETASADALSRRLAPWLAAPGITLGDAVTAAKQDLALAEPERVDAILGWTLLGDPAMAVDR